MKYILGIDTGGTYTDGVLIEQNTKKIIRKAKALTTKENLTIGIEMCIKALEIDDAENIQLVSLSTTLATNAVVEGKGGNVGLILTNGNERNVFDEYQNNYPARKIFHVGGIMNIKGHSLEFPKENKIDTAVRSMQGKVDAIAISGYASTRNPEHELFIKKRIKDTLDIPIVCAHELTTSLGMYERTVTSVLNAKLIPVIKSWLASMKEVLQQLDINAPIMVVKGDGSLMHESVAMERPVETILSGPAASIIGALHLSRQENCCIVDIGGTTTDIAFVDDGKTAINDEGATVADWKTRVKAAEINTFGLGGDSYIRITDSHDIAAGPQKAVPLCAAKELFPQLYEKMLRGNIEELDHAYSSDGFKRQEVKIALTPTDILHAEGSFVKWDRRLSCMVVDKLAEKMKMEPADFIEYVKEKICSLIYRSIPEDRLIVAIGAPVDYWMHEVERRHGINLIVPEHAEVANALGAAVGKVSEVATALIRFDKVKQRYVAFHSGGRDEYDTLETARKSALEILKAKTAEEAQKSGAEEAELVEDVRDFYYENDISGQRTYIETKVSVAAVGKPKWS